MVLFQISVLKLMLCVYLFLQEYLKMFIILLYNILLLQENTEYVFNVVAAYRMQRKFAHENVIKFYATLIISIFSTSKKYV